LSVILQKNWPQLKAALACRKRFLLTALAGIVITANWYVYIWAVANGMVLETSMAYYMSPLITFLFGVFAF
jgi:chloramphenicol-sensitive protein RarD